MNLVVSHHLEELPLFPLHAVLFPYERLQLHVFEPRYCEMMKRCIEFDSPFGVVLIRQGEEIEDTPDPYLVGTACHIEQVHHYPDGRMHVSVMGERRFRIRKLDESNPYLVGHTEPIVEADSEDTPRQHALSSRLEETFRILITGMLARPDFNIEVQLPDDPMMRSFVVARFLNLENIVKQRLLEGTDTVQRLAELIPLIEKQIVESKAQLVHRLTSEHMAEWITPN